MEQNRPAKGTGVLAGHNERVGTDDEGDVDGSDDELSVEANLEQPSGIVDRRLGEQHNRILK